MALISKPYTFSAGQTVVAAEHNDNYDTIYTDYNGNITNDNLKVGANIADTKLAQITTANKVSSTALTATSETLGDMFYYDGAQWSRLPIGTGAQTLTVAGGLPTWA
jgi:hypothetical protein